RLLCMATGIAAGAATLVRPSMVLIVGIVGIVLLWPAPPVRSLRLGLLRAGLLGLGFVLVVLPWSIRCCLVTQSFCPLGVSSGWDLYISAQQYSGEISYRLTQPEWNRIKNEWLERNEAFQQGRTETEASSPPFSVQQEVAVDSTYNRDTIARYKQLSPTRV